MKKRYIFGSMVLVGFALATQNNIIGVLGVSIFWIAVIGAVGYMFYRYTHRQVRKAKEVWRQRNA